MGRVLSNAQIFSISQCSISLLCWKIELRLSLLTYRNSYFIFKKSIFNDLQLQYQGQIAHCLTWPYLYRIWLVKTFKKCMATALEIKPKIFQKTGANPPTPPPNDVSELLSVKLLHMMAVLL